MSVMLALLLLSAGSHLVLDDTIEIPRSEWRYERAAEAAARCAELLAAHVEVVTPPGHSTLVSFRPSGNPAELVTQLEARGVIVRELPGRNLMRASCGWWTSNDDLQRLADGLAAELGG